MARKETTAAASAAEPGRLKQIALTYKMTRRADSKIGLIIAAVGIVTFGVFLAIGFWIGHPIYLGILGFLLAFLAMAIVFGRRAERAAFGQMEGQPGAAAAVLDKIGRGWTTTPAIAMNRSQDVVHRTVGKAGIVLVAEGNPNRLKPLLAAEKRKMARIVADVPVHDVIVGNGEGQVELKKLRTTLLKLPRVLQGPQVTATNDRLKAMGDLMSNMPLPKGPMPKGARIPRGGPKMR
ncbi:membrane protein [Streptomyces aureoverticillatus]|nr:membrane protein [Streptomyces aureoverticillatus]